MRSLSRAAAATVAILALASCTGTKMVQTWRDPKYQPLPVKRIFIIAVVPSDRHRVLMENTLAQTLLDKGYLSATSTGVFQEGLIDKEKATAFARSNKIDLVIVMRLTKTTELDYLPPTLDYVPPTPYYNGWWSAYGAGDGFYYTSGYLEENTTVKAETTVYSAHTDPEKLVWSGASATFNVQKAEDAAKSISDALVTDLVKSGILVK
jgi:hypothetical protein